MNEETLMKTRTEKYDVIIIGSGPGGASVASELSKHDMRVLMMERGDDAEPTGSFIQMAPNVFVPGQSLLFTDKTFLSLFRGLCTGGSSVFYCATAFEPPYGMLEKYGIALKEEVASLRKEVPMAPVSDDLMGVGALRIMESALKLGYNWKKLDKFIYPDKCRANCGKCSYGCPYGAKWTARNFVREAQDRGMTLINGARASRILFEGNRAVGVRYSKSGKYHDVFAKKIVVSAGGVGSAELLRESDFPGTGYDFFFDPLIIVFGTVEGLGSRGEIQMSAGVHNSQKGYLMADLNLPAPIYLTQAIPRMKLHKTFSQPDLLMIMVKIKDDLGGRITGSGGVRKGLGERDKAKLKEGCSEAEKILKQAGAKDIFNSLTLAAHPGGTVKINHLLDVDLKTTRENLYVCDCSVIPEAWGLPPTLTLLALGKRLGRHLVKTD
jgi:choline dehydrogenase-like flavoprotein